MEMIFFFQKSYSFLAVVMTIEHRKVPIVHNSMKKSDHIRPTYGKCALDGWFSLCTCFPLGYETYNYGKMISNSKLCFQSLAS